MFTREELIEAILEANMLHKTKAAFYRHPKISHAIVGGAAIAAGGHQLITAGGETTKGWKRVARTGGAIMAGSGVAAIHRGFNKKPVEYDPQEYSKEKKARKNTPMLKRRQFDKQSKYF